MNYTLSEAHIKIIKVILTIWTIVISTVTLANIFVFVSKGIYTHPIMFFACILTITSYINVYRFFSMVYSSNQITRLQLKIWSILFARGIFFSCLFFAIYVQNILGIIFFALTYLGTFFCNHYLVKAGVNEK